MERLLLQKSKKSSKQFTRMTAEKTIENVIQKIKEINESKEFIYKVTKAVLFGSFINSDKEKIGDLDIAIYIDLKNKSISETAQNYERWRKSLKNIPYFMRFFYGKEEVFKYIKDKKRILQLHDGVLVDIEAKEYNDPVSYIYFDKYKVIYEIDKEGNNKYERR